MSQKYLLNLSRRISLCPYARYEEEQMLSPVAIILSFLGSMLAGDKVNHLSQLIIKLQVPINFVQQGHFPPMGVHGYPSVLVLFLLALFWPILWSRSVRDQQCKLQFYKKKKKKSINLGICMCLNDSLPELLQLKMEGHYPHGYLGITFK